MAHTKANGEISEAMILAEFLRAGFPVLFPFGENQRYDMAVDAYGRLLRVQCKTASPCGWNGGRGAIRFHAYSVRLAGGKFQDREAYRDQADLFAAYAPSTGQVYVLPVDDVPETDVWLRLAPARNGQHHKIRMAEDHTMGAWVERLRQSSRMAP